MKKKPVLCGVIAAIVMLAVAVAVVIGSRFVVVDGSVYVRSGSSMDLRGRPVSLDTYRALTEEMPECEILWDVPFQGRTWSSDSRKLAVTGLTADEMELLALFPQLEELDARLCTDYELLAACRERYPDCRILYQVTVCGVEVMSDASALEVKDASVEELSEKLRWLPELTELTLTGSLPQGLALQALQEEYPSVSMHWSWEFNGQTLDNSVTRLNLAGMELEFERVRDTVDLLPQLEYADLRGTSLTEEECMALSDRKADCHFLWNMTVGGTTFSTDSEEIDLSGKIFADAAQVEALLPYFPNLRKVVMCDCGLDDETMDALNRRYEDIRFVWSVKIKYASVRTDATWFYPYKFNRNMTVTNEDLYPLRYCTDMVCIDIGHMVQVTDCEWAAYMPNLKYLIIGETAISDLTPLSNAKNLVYLEMFTVPVTDYSPLLGCTALEDLNLGKTYGSAEPIAQMTWLKNLWWCDCATKGNPCSDAVDILPEALPNTTLKLYPEHPTASGWRQLDNYFAMRDFLGMFYLT